MADCGRDVARLYAFVFLGATLQSNGLIAIESADASVEEAVGLFGWAVADLGDLNGDGSPEFGVAAPGASGFAGSLYVFDGLLALTEGSLDIGDAMASFTGDPGDQLGYSLGTLGDLDGDGLSEVVVGANSASVGGTVFVVAGATLAAGGNLNVTDALATIQGEVGDCIGDGLVDLGFVDGDGLPELAVANSCDDSFVANGGGAVVFGGATLAAGGLISMGDALAVVDGDTEDLYLGGGLAGGDLDGDGLGDLVLASYADIAGVNSGALYVFLGQSLAASSPISAADADFVFVGEVAYDAAYLGEAPSIAFLPDIDGASGLLVGAAGASPTGTDSGVAYLLLSPY